MKKDTAGSFTVNVELGISGYVTTHGGTDLRTTEDNLRNCVRFET